MASKDYSDTKLSFGGWLMVLAGIPMFLGFQAPEFSLPEASWIGNAVKTSFLVLAALMFLAGAIIWFLQRNKQDETQESTGGPEAS